MIRVRDLRVDYDDFCAVRNLSFDVKPGTVFGLLGPNGAGKTSTMRAILGLLEPTYGEVRICGIDVQENPREACRQIGFMPDFPPMYDDLLVWEFLDLFAASYYVPRAQRPEVIDRHLHLVGLWEKRDAGIPELSRGMRQRLMLAKTLIPDPQVLMLDEPASGVDPHGRADLKDILRELGARGKTVLVSSHILSEMSEFCTAVGIMERGRMVISGSVDEVRRKVMGSSKLCVEVLDRFEALHSLLARDRRVGEIEQLGPGSLEFPYTGEDDAAAELLQKIVEAGIPVIGFGRKKEGLEEVFLKVGARELN